MIACCYSIVDCENTLHSNYCSKKHCCQIRRQSWIGMQHKRNNFIFFRILLGFWRWSNSTGLDAFIFYFIYCWIIHLSQWPFSTKFKFKVFNRQDYTRKLQSHRERRWFFIRRNIHVQRATAFSRPTYSCFSGAHCHWYSAFISCIVGLFLL